MHVTVRTGCQALALTPCSLEGFAYQFDPYVGCAHRCCYCYAQNRTEVDWEHEVLIHEGLTEELDSELSGITPQTIYVGMNTDPYQPVEQEYLQTRRALQALARRGFSACILTKSGLATRDVDLLSRMSGSSVGFSIAFHDEGVRRLFESNAPANDERVSALKMLKEAGIETYMLICPVMPPPITDVDAIIDVVAPYVDTIWVYALRMKGEEDANWRKLEAVLSSYFPDTMERCKEMAFTPTHPHWDGLRANLERIRSERGLNMRVEL